MDDLKTFYDREYKENKYASATKAQSHSFYPRLKSFVDKYKLDSKRCLEIGCGRGAFQDIVDDYTGVDISDSVKQYFSKPFYSCSATELPFEDNSFDAIWSYAVLEHIPQPELVLQEMRRILRHQGRLLLAPAWQCRPWAAQGYPVRPYSDFDLLGKFVKASVPVRNSLLFRSTYVFPKRFFRFIQHKFSPKPLSFHYDQLIPNYEHYWTSDSDAVNSMDPYEAILWFISRGDTCTSHQTEIDQFCVRTGALEFQVNKAEHRQALS